MILIFVVISLNAENLRVDGNNLTGRASTEVCALRDSKLVEFVADCPDRNGAINSGVVCGVPTCCSACRVD